jgi:hypothetical protein
MLSSRRASPPRHGKAPSQLYAITDSVGRQGMQVRLNLADAKRAAVAMDATPGSGGIRVFGPYTLENPDPIPLGEYEPPPAKVAPTTKDGHVVMDSSGRQLLLERVITQNRMGAYAHGAERAADWIIEQAVNEFRDGKDEQATALRHLAEKLRTVLVPRLQREAEEHAKNFPMALGEGEPTGQ